MHLATGASHQLRGRGVLGDFGGECANAATVLQERLVPQHRFALCETDADRFRSILPAALRAIEEGAFHIGPEPHRAGTERRRADQPAIRPPGRHHGGYVGFRHQHVRIGENHPFIFGGPPALDAIVQLRIGADAVITDQQLHGDRGKCGRGLADFRDHGIGFVCDAEQQLIIRPVEPEGTRERQRREVLDAAQRHHQRDRRLLPDKIVFRVPSRQSPVARTMPRRLKARSIIAQRAKTVSMLASSTPKLLAVHPPLDSMEFVSADYNVCVTVTCHDRQARGCAVHESAAEASRKEKPFMKKGSIIMTVSDF